MGMWHDFIEILYHEVVLQRCRHFVIFSDVETRIEECAM